MLDQGHQAEVVIATSVDGIRHFVDSSLVD